MPTEQEQGLNITLSDVCRVTTQGIVVNFTVPLIHREESFNTYVTKDCKGANGTGARSKYNVE